MKLLTIFAHPEGPSLNQSILKSVEVGADLGHHELKICDLYALNFNPVLSKDELTQGDGKVSKDVEYHQQLVRWADILIFIYPIWWYDRPAILKGWIDRVFTFGFAYGPSPHGITGLLKQSQAVVFQTAGSGEEKFKSLGGHSAVEGAMREGTLNYCGIQNVDMHTFYATHAKSKSEIAELLKDVEQIVKQL